MYTIYELGMLSNKNILTHYHHGNLSLSIALMNLKKKCTVFASRSLLWKGASTNNHFHEITTLDRIQAVFRVYEYGLCGRLPR